MNAILRFIDNMIPYMVLSMPLYLIARIIIVKKKGAKINWFHEAGSFIFAVFLVGLASQTVIPKLEFGNVRFNIVTNGIHKTNLIPFNVFRETYIEVMHGNINALLINFLGNILMFAPIGFFLSLLWDMKARKATLIGFSISLFIEITQLFLPRGTDVDDLILNTAGTLLGFLIYKLLSKVLGKVISKFRYQK
ncbi:MAG: VanZ family protein [Ruminococcaceae bacterium]|nr:VanZ family protein [Oscillospiraceae bacterium]